MPVPVHPMSSGQQTYLQEAMASDRKTHTRAASSPGPDDERTPLAPVSAPHQHATLLYGDERLLLRLYLASDVPRDLLTTSSLGACIAYFYHLPLAVKMRHSHTIPLCRSMVICTADFRNPPGLHVRLPGSEPTEDDISGANPTRGLICCARECRLAVSTNVLFLGHSVTDSHGKEAMPHYERILGGTATMPIRHLPSRRLSLAKLPMGKHKTDVTVRGNQGGSKRFSNPNRTSVSNCRGPCFNACDDQACQNSFQEIAFYCERLRNVALTTLQAHKLPSITTVGYRCLPGAGNIEVVGPLK
ncbi:uncharacterized protein BDR25DRAFT_359722 [Lindgomyces ingoldianus]|uniref:Uncharacterized protein n=1 Tax=Lindgomyces ingoldianus TaxID=673940 RepID=A0ACB6QJQ7_9PLEO|nr:uncharacterized protein BDR25DRAFT_359722 [Lindgomyces ingoldianus]KAF2466371.1 hypothetical protein BDR25DRAFT_359722 [Lindgomyces ingoldianus]